VFILRANNAEEEKTRELKRIFPLSLTIRDFTLAYWDQSGDKKRKSRDAFKNIWDGEKVDLSLCLTD
jgi:hypothetical protein